MRNLKERRRRRRRRGSGGLPLERAARRRPSATRSRWMIRPSSW